MRFKNFFMATAIVAMVAVGNGGDEKNVGRAAQPSPQKVRVQIQVIADSSNSLQANVEVSVGASAREVMERLFKMSYADFAHRFVNGIAGFMVPPREKKFWRLEIDGKASEVGIAEIKIDRALQMRWVMAEYQ